MDFAYPYDCVFRVFLYLRTLYAFRAKIPADPSTLHIYASAYLRAQHVPRFIVCLHALRPHLSLSTHLLCVSTRIYNCMFMHLISTVLKTLLISDKRKDKESTEN